ncbi:MAG: 30S ribosomal protein S24e [Acidilobus sp.]
MPEAAKRIDLGDGVWLEVLSERRSDLLGRVDVEALAHHELKSTPARASIREALAKAYSRDPSAVYVKTIKTSYGVGISKVHAHIYDRHEDALKFEPQYVLARHGEAEKKQAKGK